MFVLIRRKVLTIHWMEEKGGSYYLFCGCGLEDVLLLLQLLHLLLLLLVMVATLVVGNVIIKVLVFWFRRFC